MDLLICRFAGETGARRAEREPDVQTMSRKDEDAKRESDGNGTVMEANGRTTQPRHGLGEARTATVG